ncbi:MAG: ThuA domain-containing protein [Chloroflexi bacterium]|nr:ThuA domain-containing protein [Chloroflexota bacterium]
MAQRTEQDADTNAPLRVLMVTATAGYRHQSIPTACEAVQKLAEDGRAFSVTTIPTVDDLERVDANRLTEWDVVLFVSTSGELPFSDSQKSALLDFVRHGAGFVGVHGASATSYDWANYHDLLGAAFKEHPWVQEGTVVAEDRSHPSTRHLDARFSTTDEFYIFRTNPRPNVQVLLSLDASSVGGEGDYPLAWHRQYGEGRVFYTALGHFDSNWHDPRFIQHLAGGLLWAGRRAE